MSVSDLYEIRVEGRLATGWSHWLGDLAINQEDDGETTLFGPELDQAALPDTLGKILDLNLKVISVTRVKREQVDGQQGRSVF